MARATPGRGALTLTFGGVPIAVSSPDERLLARLATYFERFSVPARRAKRPRATIEAVSGPPPEITAELRPWDSRGKESFADVAGTRLIRKDRTGTMVSIEGGGERWSVCGDLHRSLPQVINIVAAAYGIALLDRGGAMLHASAAVHNGAAIAVIGESGSGKSSVAVRLLERGFDFLSNDRLIVRTGTSSALAYGLPKQPRVNPGTLLAGERTRMLIDENDRHRYEQLPAGKLWDLEEKHDLDVQGALGRNWVPSAPLAFAVTLAWRHRDDGLTLERLDGGQALESLRAASKTFGPFDLHLEDRSDTALRAMARSVPVYRVTGKVDPPALAELLAQRGRP
jgi:HprK-related kinase B